MYINMAPPLLRNAVHAISPTIKVHYPSNSTSTLAIQLSSLKFTDHPCKVQTKPKVHVSSHSISKNGKNRPDNLPPLRLHPLPSSRHYLHHPLRANNNPPHLPAHQDLRLVSNTHSHRRSLYVALSLCPPTNARPHLLIRSSQLNSSATSGVRYPVSKATIGQSGHTSCKACCSCSRLPFSQRAFTCRFPGSCKALVQKIDASSARDG